MVWQVTLISLTSNFRIMSMLRSRHLQTCLRVLPETSLILVLKSSHSTSLRLLIERVEICSHLELTMILLVESSRRRREEERTSIINRLMLKMMRRPRMSLMIPKIMNSTTLRRKTKKTMKMNFAERRSKMPSSPDKTLRERRSRIPRKDDFKLSKSKGF